MKPAIPTLFAIGLLSAPAALFVYGQAKSEATAAAGPVASFTATSDNVSGAPDNIRIEILRWSSDSERQQLADAWNLKPAPAPGRKGAGRGAGAAAGRGGAGRQGRGGRGASPEADADATADPFGTFRLAERGRGGRGGDGPPPPPPTPEDTLAKALQQSATVGYLWSSEVAGYAIRYAGKFTGSDGSERLLLITDRRLGATSGQWTPAGSAPPSNYDFSVIELRLGPKGDGEGKISVTGKVGLDSALQIVAPDNYGALPVVLKNVKRTKA